MNKYLTLSLSVLLLACSTKVDRTYAGHRFLKYSFQDSRILTPKMSQKLGLQKLGPNNENNETNSQYVLYQVFTQDFMDSTPGKEKLYLVGHRRTEMQDSFATLQDYYSLIAVLIAGNTEPLHYMLKDADRDSAELAKDFYLFVHDFDGDGKYDILSGFESYRNQYQYYIHRFEGKQLGTILRPWNSFTEEERANGTAKNYSPFMREISADIYPAFIAEIEMNFNQKISIDLSSLANDLIRDGVYDKEGLLLQKKGIPHVDFNPILFPVRPLGPLRLRRNAPPYMIRSVQQVRNRYGQLGIYVCNWRYTKGRWIPDVKSAEFLVTPRI